MTDVTCERCGTDYDTERAGATPGQDTTRCPSCGKKQPVVDGGSDVEGAPHAAPGSDDHPMRVGVGDDGRLVLEIHAHIHVHE